MLNFINKNKIIIITFSITLILGISTFLTFIDRSFIQLNENNLQSISLIGISCTNLLQFAIPKLNKKKTLIIICSSNIQNFIATLSNSEKYLINKIDTKFYSTKNNFNQYNYCISNSRLSLNIIEMLSLNICQQINFTEIVRLNLNKILSLSA